VGLRSIVTDQRVFVIFDPNEIAISLKSGPRSTAKIESWIDHLSTSGSGLRIRKKWLMDSCARFPGTPIVMPL
jgi:hypothetical protein